MKLTNFEGRFLKSVCASATVQGAAWTILSLVCIILHNSSHRLSPPDTYTENLSYALYYRFIKDASGEVEWVIRPSDFFAFMWIYFMGSVIWMVLSIDLYFGIKSEKQRLPAVMMIWSVFVISLSIIDIILMSLLVRDYRSCKDDPKWVFCFLINGIGMTLAARGYLLWLLNIGSAIIMLTLGIMMHREKFLTKSVRTPRLQVTDNRNWADRGTDQNVPQPYVNRSNNIRNGF